MILFLCTQLLLSLIHDIQKVDLTSIKVLLTTQETESGTLSNYGFDCNMQSEFVWVRKYKFMYRSISYPVIQGSHLASLHCLKKEKPLQLLTAGQTKCLSTGTNKTITSFSKYKSNYVK